jgi:hypothetical protein
VRCSMAVGVGAAGISGESDISPSPLFVGFSTGQDGPLMHANYGGSH